MRPRLLCLARRVVQVSVQDASLFVHFALEVLGDSQLLCVLPEA